MLVPRRLFIFALLLAGQLALPTASHAINKIWGNIDRNSPVILPDAIVTDSSIHIHLLDSKLNTEQQLFHDKLGKQQATALGDLKNPLTCCTQTLSTPASEGEYASTSPMWQPNTLTIIGVLAFLLVISAAFLRRGGRTKALKLNAANAKLLEEIAERKRTESLLKAQNQILEIVANGAPLTQTLTKLVEMIEALSPDIKGSILLLDEDGIHIRHGAAPSLPPEFVALIDGQPIGPNAGSCGTAAWLKEEVFVADIATDPLWEQYKSAALPHGLQACWSTPILDEHQKVLGTFAMYQHRPGLPSPEHKKLINISISIAAIAINHQRTQQTLHAKSAELELYFTNSLDLLCIANISGYFLRLNPQWETTLGHALEELEGQRFIDFVHPEDVETTRGALTLLPTQKHILNFVNRYRHKDGSYRWLEWRAFVADKGLFYAVARDVTVQKQAESALRESEERLRLVLDGLGEHMFVGLMDTKGTILLANRPALESANLEPADAIGKPVQDTYWWSHSEDVRQRLTAAVERAANGESVRYDEQIRIAHEQLIWVDFSVHPLRDKQGNVSYIVPSGIIIAERKRAEIQLLQLNRFYITLSETNEAIVRATDEDLLFKRVCEIVEQSAGFQLAWIGKPKDESVQVIAAAGSALGYLEGINISVNADNPYGVGPTGRVIRSGQYYVCNDFMNDSATQPWREKASAFGIRSSAVFPLKKAGKIAATLNVYSSVPDIFHAAEVKLLEELAQDISFALDHLQQQSDLQQTMTSLQASKLKVEESNLKLGISEEKYRSIYESLQDVYVDITLDGRILDVSSQITKLTNGQYTSGDLIGTNIKSIYHDLDQWEELLAILEQDSRVADFEVDLKNKEGELIPCSISASFILGEDGIPSRVAGMFRDITERNSNLAKLSYLSQYDALTDLPNRLLFKDRLDQAIIEADRHESLVVVLLLDLDRFKSINDTLGHQAGDYILIEVGNRLTQALRQGDTISRLSGDEFALALADVHTVEDATLLLSNITELFNAPIIFDNRELFLTASIGITIYPLDKNNSEILLRNADIAMNRAKENGFNNYQFYDSEMTVNAQYRLSLEEALQHAVEREELVLHYQPQVDLSSGTICGMEALVRWNHPELGLVSPATFIPLAEETGLILPIGEWVLRTAARQMKLWQEQGHTSLRMAVNLSSRQFRESNILEVVKRVLDDSSLEARFLELELTESMLMKNVDQTIQTLISLRELGLQFSIDDFGTGYSSLSYLRRFPISVLKIDKSFVCDINEEQGAASIVKTIIQMAHSLDMMVVAEGVETHEQLQFLRDNLCDSIQGYYFSKPVPAEEFTKLLQSKKSLPKTRD